MSEEKVEKKEEKVEVMEEEPIRKVVLNSENNPNYEDIMKVCFVNEDLEDDPDFINPKTFFEVFTFFHGLKLKKYQYVILKKVQEIHDQEVIIDLFKKSFQKEPEFFNDNCCNILKERFEEKNYTDKLEEKELDYVKKYTIKPVKELTLCKESTFTDLYTAKLKRLYGKREETANLKILAKDKGEVACHKEIILFESDYFYRVLKNPKFKECEQLDKGILFNFILDKPDVELIIEYIYLKNVEINEKKFIPGFNLLAAIGPYKEEDLEEMLVEKLRKFSLELIAKNEESFQKMFAELKDKFYNELKDEQRQLFLNDWSDKFKK